MAQANFELTLAQADLDLQPPEELVTEITGLPFFFLSPLLLSSPLPFLTLYFV